MVAKGPDDKKSQAIISLLEDNPQGIWTREIARNLEMSKSTVSRYLNSYLADKIEENYMGRNRIVKLKTEEESKP